jgi:NADH-ubiquinone oxidoreductase chain 4L
MTLSIVLFLLGILGFVLNRKNIILMLISIEIMLLAVTVLVIVSSFAFDDIVGQTYSIYIIAIAGAESAIGLGILVAFYRLNIPPCLSKHRQVRKEDFSIKAQYRDKPLSNRERNEHAQLMCNTRLQGNSVILHVRITI